jgi:hypothetical protein
MDALFDTADVEIDDMARRARSTDRNAAPTTGVATHLAALKTAGTDDGAFKRALAAISSNESISTRELGQIAVAYRGGGPMPDTRKAALRVIEKRQLELVRNKAQIQQASKARPW